MSSLCQELDVLSEHNILNEKICEIPDYIIKNINKKFILRYYQKEAVKRFIYYIEHFNNRKKPSHILYHMATGSGKTLIMATNILYLYKKGYNKFLFFVDNKNTIDKTKNNFLDKSSIKYLFTKVISFMGERVQIREVENFESINENDINIKFSTIQGLHECLNAPKENSITYQSLKNKEIVLISDEAHHLNALTKSDNQMTSDEIDNIKTWEETVTNIFRQNKENILLEFTATVETEKPGVKEKYDDKIIFKYPLKQFRIDKFSKEVKVIEGDFNKKKRALQAIILSQYRRKVAEENNIFLKPVVMIKSNSIAKSEEFEEEFNKMINSLNYNELFRINDDLNGSIINKAFDYFEDKKISMDNLVRELKVDFNRERQVSVNSQNESEEKQVLLNTLEDEDNQIRVIFAVDKLNEGWDVLNLFDIVRTYRTGASSTSGPRKTTIKEAQLIGRGARYFPFKLNEEQEKYKRKYDDDLDNDLRILEELYYHCYNEPSYISELKTALEDEGIIPPEKREVKLEVKEEFKKSQFWQKGLIFKNKREEKDRGEIDSLDDVEVSKSFVYNFATGRSSEIAIFEEDEEIDFEDNTKTYLLSDIRYNIIRKAFDKLKFYRFNNLQQYFSNLSSIREFICEDKFLASRKVNVIGTEQQIEKLSDEDKLEISKHVCNNIARQIKANFTEHKGTEIFIGEPIEKVVTDKTRKFESDAISSGEGKPMSEENRDLRLDLSQKEWYVYNENYGTDQEKYFIRFLNNMIDDLKEVYDEIYLIRNERLFQIYDFDKGRAFEPDFVLHMRKENDETFCHYQLFIEPKGEQLIPNEKWKEEFLEEIKTSSEVESEVEGKILAENLKFKIIGLPFYNNEETREENFQMSLFNELEFK